MVSFDYYPEGTLPDVSEDCIKDWSLIMIKFVINHSRKVTLSLNKKLESLKFGGRCIGGRFEIALEKNDRPVMIIETKKFDFSQGKLLNFLLF
jgi:hypothetical protein